MAKTPEQKAAEKAAKVEAAKAAKAAKVEAAKAAKAAKEAAASATDDVEVVELPAEGEATTTVKIVAKRDLKVGDRVRKEGELLATVVLEHDVNIGFLTRAHEDCLVGLAPVVEKK